MAAGVFPCPNCGKTIVAFVPFVEAPDARQNEWAEELKGWADGRGFPFCDTRGRPNISCPHCALEIAVDSVVRSFCLCLLNNLPLEEVVMTEPGKN